MARKKTQTPSGALASRLVPIQIAPEPNAGVVCLVNRGTYLQVTKEDGKWTQVLFGNVEGWAPADALDR